MMLLLLAAIQIGYGVFGVASSQNYTLCIGEQCVIDSIPPYSNHPDDIVCAVGESTQIQWILYDDFGGGFYRVMRNGNVYTGWKEWKNGEPIGVSVDTSTEGEFQYTIEFNDSSGNMGSPDTVLVKVTRAEEKAKAEGAQAAPYTPPQSPNFLINLSINPKIVKSGESVQVLVTIINAGNAAGSYNVSLYVDGILRFSQIVYVAAGGSGEITFDLTEETGVHVVRVESRSERFVVLSPSNASEATENEEVEGENEGTNAAEVHSTPSQGFPWHFAAIGAACLIACSVAVLRMGKEAEIRQSRETCAFCGKPITQDQPIVICKTCHLPHHVECWDEGGGCARGCRT